MSESLTVPCAHYLSAGKAGLNHLNWAHTARRVHDIRREAESRSASSP